MNGKPLAGATVVFHPVPGTGGVQDVGGDSYGKTDEEGRYTLRTTLTDDEGAIVGHHTVTITLDAFEELLPESDDAGNDKRGPNPIPEQYNRESELKFTVTNDGSTKANFNLKNPKFAIPKKK